VRTPEGEILPDLTGKVAGRGCYICASEECFEKMFAKKLLSRAFKREVPKEVYDKIRASGYEIKR